MVIESFLLVLAGDALRRGACLLLGALMEQAEHLVALSTFTEKLNRWPLFLVTSLGQL